MAKKSKKYSFQRNKKATLSWIIGIVAVIAAIVIGIVAYNNSRITEFDVAVPDAEKLSFIADNLDVLTTHTDKITAAPQEDGSTTLQLASEHAQYVYLYVNNGIENPAEFRYGNFVLPNLFTAPLGTDLKQGELHLQTGDENLMIYAILYPATAADDAVIDAIIAELEAIIAEGPVVTEETTEEAETVEEATEAAEDAAETAEETTEESAETAEDTTEAAE